MFDERAYPVIDLIIDHESRGAVTKQKASSPYDVVWGGIKKADYPPKPLTQMTVAEVLAWQDSIDRRYQSEAAGAGQILEDTLRDLVNDGAADPGDMFDPDTQNRLILALMRRRGWDAFISRRMTIGAFGDNLAREWASFPVHSTQQGAKRQVHAGQSYYAGDGLNKAHATTDEVTRALEAARGQEKETEVPEKELISLPAEQPTRKVFFGALAAIGLVFVNKTVPNLYPEVIASPAWGPLYAEFLVYAPIIAMSVAYFIRERKLPK